MEPVAAIESGPQVTSLDLSGFRTDLTIPVGELVTAPPLTLLPHNTVAKAARDMRAANTTAAIVLDDPPGIITDRDLRVRVLAEGLDADTAVASVMSRPIRSLRSDTPIFGALLWIVEERFHHLPITRAGQIVGILGERDLLRHQAGSPLVLLYRIGDDDGAQDPLDGYAGTIARTARSLLEGGLDAAEIARVVAALNDALIARLLRLAERELGPPPCAYAWMVLGSEGRMEQVLLSDQDNALVYAAGSPEADRYFPALAERVVGELIHAGFPRCPGGYMATNWCRSLEDWEATFRGWIQLPEPQSRLEAEVFFDFRAVHGELSLQPLERILRGGGGHTNFLTQLARAAQQFRPPLRTFNRLPRDGSLDLKAGGIAALVGIARMSSLEAGVAPRPTLQRLDAASKRGTLSREGAESLADTFRFLLRLRLRHQLRAVAAGEPVSNDVRLDELSALERRRLREALKTIRHVQDAIALRYRVGRE